MTSSSSSLPASNNTTRSLDDVGNNNGTGNTSRAAAVIVNNGVVEETSSDLRNLNIANNDDDNDESQVRMLREALERSFDAFREIQQQMHELETDLGGGGGGGENDDRLAEQPAIAAVREAMLASIEEQFVEITSQYSSRIMSKSCLLSVSDTKRLPIHLACEYSAPITIIQSLLDCDKSKQSILAKDKWGDLPIHIACSRGPDFVKVVKLLLDNDPSKQTISIKDCNDYMPIHMACRYVNEDAIRLLIETDHEVQQSMIVSAGGTSQKKSTLLEEGIHGQYPIHICCRNDASPKIIQTLLNADVSRSSVLKQDDGDRIPIHVYLVRHTNLQVIRLLLEAMIQDRIYSRGLENFKLDIFDLCRKLTDTHERDFMTREKLDVIAQTIKEVLLGKQVLLLELICWKVSILTLESEDENQTEDDTIANTTANGDNSDHDRNNHHRHHARIVSGADIIIREVLPFIENESIDIIISKFKIEFQM